MFKTPFIQRLDRWVDFCQTMGWPLKRLLVHPTDYYPNAQGRQSPAHKLGYVHRGLPIVPLNS